jgi:hypothetical protein
MEDAPQGGGKGFGAVLACSRITTTLLVVVIFGKRFFHRRLLQVSVKGWKSCMDKGIRGG